MKAIVITAHGGPEQLNLRDIEIAAPGPGEALVQVAAAGVNFMDVGTRRGFAGGKTDLPMTPGVEGAGRVLAVGEGVVHVKPGDRVAWFFAWGSYAEQMIAPANALVCLPDDIDDETAASVMMQGLTASHFVFESYAIQPGDTALVHAAAGGVGLLLTQMIKLLGGRVIGRVSNASKVAVAKAAGTDEVIVSADGRFADAVLALTGGQGVQAVYDGSGGETFDDFIRSLDFHGTLAVFGPMMAPVAPVDLFQLPKSIKLTYPTVHHHVRTLETLERRSAQLFDWIRGGQLKLQAARRYPLAKAAQAHRDIEFRATTGKLLLIP